MDERHYVREDSVFSVRCSVGRIWGWEMDGVGGSSVLTARLVIILGYE